MQWLYRVVGQAGIFLICAQTIVHFRPKEAYEKYLKLLLSVMLLTQLLQPVLSVFGGGADQNVQAQVEEFTEEMQSVLNRASEPGKTVAGRHREYGSCRGAGSRGSSGGKAHGTKENEYGKCRR